MFNISSDSTFYRISRNAKHTDVFLTFLPLPPNLYNYIVGINKNRVYEFWQKLWRYLFRKAEKRNGTFSYRNCSRLSWRLYELSSGNSHLKKRQHKDPSNSFILRCIPKIELKKRTWMHQSKWETLMQQWEALKSLWVALSALKARLKMQPSQQQTSLCSFAISFFLLSSKPAPMFL